MPIDYKKYPANWLSEIRPRIMKRAENKCEMCGLEHKQKVYSLTLKVSDSGRCKNRAIWFRHKDDAIRESENIYPKELTVILTIAHLDHDETNHDVADDRLRALCQICHLRLDATEKYRRSQNNNDL